MGYINIAFASKQGRERRYLVMGSENKIRLLNIETRKAGFCICRNKHIFLCNNVV